MKLHTDKLIESLSNGLCVTGLPVRAIGIDLVHVPRIEESLRDFGERFEKRMFTGAEADYARSAPAQHAERLAARFAAKEAAIKALSLSEAGLDWRDIEVLRREDGSCTLALHGTALQEARRQGVSGALVSLSYDGEYAAAMVAVLSDSRAT